MTGYRVGEKVGWTTGGTHAGTGDAVEVVAARLPDGPPYALRGSAALIWLAATEGGTPEDVVGRVADRTGQDAGAVDYDVRRALADLAALGLLEPVTD